jgi:hypothetical protein
MRVIQDNLYLCSDCTMVVCNGFSGAVMEPEQLQATESGLARLGPDLVPDFDSETEDGINCFSRMPCKSCGTDLAGYRARFAILGE